MDTIRLSLALTGFLSLALLNCGGGTPTVGATLTITTAGVSPKAVTIKSGQSIKWVNNDAIGHAMASDPHPDHTDCPALNGPNNGNDPIQPGASYTTQALTVVRTCGFHDHDDSGNDLWKGTVTVQ